MRPGAYQETAKEGKPAKYLSKCKKSCWESCHQLKNWLRLCLSNIGMVTVNKNSESSTHKNLWWSVNKLYLNCGKEAWSGQFIQSCSALCLHTPRALNHSSRARTLETDNYYPLSWDLLGKRLNPRTLCLQQILCHRLPMKPEDLKKSKALLCHCKCWNWNLLWLM